METLEISTKLGDFDAQVTCHINIGDIHRQQNRYEQAISSLKKALSISEKHDILLAKASSMAGLGIIYQNKNDPNQARSYLKQAIGIYKKIGAMDTENAKSAQELLQSIEQQQNQNEE